jgi:hypothetical protein
MKSDAPYVIDEHKQNLLNRCGKLLYGNNWRTLLAKTLGKTPKTIQRYMMKDTPIRYEIPDACWPVLVKTLEDRVRDIEDMIYVLTHGDEAGSKSLIYWAARKRLEKIALDTAKVSKK